MFRVQDLGFRVSGWWAFLQAFVYECILYAPLRADFLLRCWFDVRYVEA